MLPARMVPIRDEARVNTDIESGEEFNGDLLDDQR